MDVYSLKQELIKNPDKIELILHKVGFENISDKFNHGLEYRCGWEEDSNPTGVRISKETLSAQCFSRGIKGDLITLIQEKLKCRFPEAIDKISSIIEFKDEKKDIERLPFGGFYKRIKKMREVDGNIELQTYDESILDDYLVMPSLRFIEDGIKYNVQLKYQIGYDVFTNRIIVVWRGFDGRIVGIMGRLNKDNLDPNENKWFPILKFPKSKAIFGFSENYHKIQEDRFVIIGESEKFPMQMESKGIFHGLGLGGNNLTDYQANNIKSLFPTKSITCLDEGLSRENSVHVAEKLKMDGMFKNESYYIYDKNNLWLPKGSKMSLSDLPLSDIKSVLKQCIYKV